MKPAFLISIFIFCARCLLADDVAFPEVLSRAKAGDLTAQGQVAMRYMAGDGVVKNYVAAGQWATVAANRGNRLAQYVLGTLHRDGNGVKESQEDALRWLRRSANQGNTRAQYGLAILHFVGRGKKPDLIEAYKWFLLALSGEIE